MKSKSKKNFCTYYINNNHVFRDNFYDLNKIEFRHFTVIHKWF